MVHKQVNGIITEMVWKVLVAQKNVSFSWWVFSLVLFICFEKNLLFLDNIFLVIDLMEAPIFYFKI